MQTRRDQTIKLCSRQFSFYCSLHNYVTFEPAILSNINVLVTRTKLFPFLIVLSLPQVSFLAQVLCISVVENPLLKFLLLDTCECVNSFSTSLRCSCIKNGEFLLARGELVWRENFRIQIFVLSADFAIIE